MVSEISHKASKMVVRVQALDEAAELMRSIAGNRRADESLKAVLRRVGRKLEGWTPSRVRAVWYRDERVHLRADEIEQLRAIAAPSEDPAGDELAELRQQIARMESRLQRLEATDEAFHSQDIAALRDQIRQAG